MGYKRLEKKGAESSPASILSTIPTAARSKTPVTHRAGRTQLQLSQCLATDPSPSTPRGDLMGTALAHASTFSRNESGVAMCSPLSVTYQVHIPSGISVRVGPDVNSLPTGANLLAGEVFQVSESAFGTDGWRHLRLADGRGWVPAEMSRMHDKQQVDTRVHIPSWARCHHAKLVGMPPGLEGEHLLQ